MLDSNLPLNDVITVMDEGEQERAGLSHCCHTIDSHSLLLSVKIRHTLEMSVPWEQH